jgi:hypothetical protein
MKANVHILSFAFIAALFIVWIFSKPIFHLCDNFTRRARQKLSKEKLRGCVTNNGIRRRAILAIIWTATTIWLRTAQAQSQTSLNNSASDAVLTLKPSNTSIWQNGIGDGFKPGIQSISFDVGAGYGVEILGGRESHDLALASLSYGDMLGSVEGEGHWYRGNWEFRGELFSGAQFSPTDEWLVGLTPHLRYNFATGTRWVPFVDLGAGVSATSIGPPDLSHYFEFNLQAATGVRWFIRNNVALSIEARYLHMSCAGLSTPNLGLNNVNGMVGISWFF